MDKDPSGTRRKASQRASQSAGVRRSALRDGGRNESQADPVLLDPGDIAVVDGGAVGHHQTKARRHEGWILDIDSGAVRGNVANHAAHDRTARRYEGRFVDLDPLMLAPFVHGPPALRSR